MTQARRAYGRQSIAPRPDVPVVEYHHEISEANFQKIKEAVADLNDPKRKRHLVSSVEGCD
jgi:hypothetical protein